MSVIVTVLRHGAKFRSTAKQRAPQMVQLLLVALVAGVGLAAAAGANIQNFEHSTLYVTIATTLLCFGLYMAGYGIDLGEARKHWRIVGVAITIGVIAKYLIIAGIAYALTRDIRYAVLGMAVAQMDPLSVAALNNNPRMSPRTKTVLNMWASFDDPVTALITPVLLVTLASSGGFQLAHGVSLSGTMLNLLPFVLFVIGTGVVVMLRRRNVQAPRIAAVEELRTELRAHAGEGPKTAVVQAIMLIATISRSAPLAAIFSLFVRPAWLGGRLGDLLTKTALYGATFLLGMLLSGGVDITGGLVLGGATYLSQLVVAWGVVALGAWLTPAGGHDESDRFSARDVWHLALAQQNGITAIVLALVLQPSIPIAVSTISLAIVVVNVANFVCNEAFDRLAVPWFWPLVANVATEDAEA